MEQPNFRIARHEREHDSLTLIVGTKYLPEEIRK